MEKQLPSRRKMIEIEMRHLKVEEKGAVKAFLHFSSNNKRVSSGTFDKIERIDRKIEDRSIYLKKS